LKRLNSWPMLLRQLKGMDIIGYYKERINLPGTIGVIILTVDKSTYTDEEHENSNSTHT
jgi:hypothetical protein